MLTLLLPSSDPPYSLLSVVVHSPVLCSGKDLPWSHWCCLHKRQNSIWCKAAQASSHVFWGKIRGKKDGRMMRRSLPAPFHSMHHHASHWSQFAIERKIRVCGEKKNLVKCKRFFPTICILLNQNDKNVVFAGNESVTEIIFQWIFTLLFTFPRSWKFKLTFAKWF